MSRVNLTALALAVSGIWLVLAGLELGVLPHLVGADGMIAMFRWQDDFLGIPRSSSPELETWISDPLAFLALTVMAMSIPLVAGVALLLAGFFVRRSLGRPADLRAEEDADVEPARERALQWLIRDRLIRLPTAGASPPTAPDAGEALARLDARRRYRLELFLHHAGLDPLPGGLPPAVFASPPASLETRRRFGPILSILLLGMAGFALLWGFLSAFSVRLLPEAVGYPTVPNLSLSPLLLCGGTALVLLLAAWGVRRLQRLDRRLEQRWRTAGRTTAEIVLAGYDECLEHLAHGPGSEDETRASRLVRGLREAAKAALDDEGKRVLTEIDRARGTEGPVTRSLVGG